jgi:undecaprenyl-diphosphatase
VDYFLFREINGLAGWPVADTAFRAVADAGAAVIAACVAAVFLWPWRQQRTARRRAAVFATAAAGASLLANQPLAHLVGRLRPYVAHPHHVHLLIARSHDPSFPSDHATGAFALAMGVWFYDRKLARILFALAGLLAFSRVYVGTHYPGDVAGGALIGAGIATALHWSPLRLLIDRASDMFAELWDWTRLGAIRFERRYPAGVLLTGAGVALLAVSELADRVEHGLGAVMTLTGVALTAWLLVLSWLAMRRLGPRIRRGALVGWLRDWILAPLVILSAGLILFVVVAAHLSSAPGADAWLAMTGAAFVLIAQIIGQGTPHNGD